MTTPAPIYIEILNTNSSAFASTSTWTDITSDTLSAQVTALGFMSPRSGSPSQGNLTLVLNDSANAYLPDVTGYASNKITENMNRIRIRAGGTTLGNCLKVSFAGGSPNAGTIAQTYTAAIAAASVWTFSYYARAQYDFVGNTDTVTLKSNLADITTTTPTYTNKWIQYTSTLTISATPAASLTVQVAPGANTVGHQYIEYKNFSLTCPSVNSGNNVLTNGSFGTGLLTPWVVTGLTGTTVTAAVIPDTWITFNGKILNVQPDSALNGTQQTVLTCADFLYIFTITKLNPPPAIQQNVSTDSLINTILTFLQASRSTAWWPGQLVDTGILANVDTAFDKYTSNSTAVVQAIDDIVNSEYGYVWFDLDGTFRFGNQQWIAKKQRVAAAITLTDGYPFAIAPQRDIGAVVNNATVTYHPRVSTGALNTVWTQNTTTPTAIPPGQTVTLTCPFHDAYGLQCGAKSVVTALVAGTDYKATDSQDGLGFDYSYGGRLTITCTVATQAGQAQATQATITMSHTCTGTLYMNILQIRGIPVTSYSPVQVTATDATSITRYLQRDWNKDLPFVNDNQTAQSIANYYVGRYKNPFFEAPSFQVQNKSTLNGIDLLGLGIGDQAAITSSKTGLSAAKHIIAGINYTLHPNAGIYAVQQYTATMRIGDPGNYFTLDASVLDGTDILFI